MAERRVRFYKGLDLGHEYSINVVPFFISLEAHGFLSLLLSGPLQHHLVSKGEK